MMTGRTIAGRTLDKWMQEHPLLHEIIAGKEVFWSNPQYRGFEIAKSRLSLTEKHLKEAEDRLNSFAAYICKVFPETRDSKGIVESPLLNASALKQRLSEEPGWQMSGSLLLKCDNQLPISGSIKARGGIYEVLKHAESLALEQGLLKTNHDYSVLASAKFREFFSGYSLAVGSTGNLGLSIGIMGAMLGFQVFVHMSAEAKQWKKDLLRQKGVIVLEYESDYGKAVEEGRRQAESDPKMHFIDDENSSDLFLGYAVAASRLKRQLQELKISIDAKHPLFVYLPCGVGGGPGGITFGLKQVFKDNVHCFFAEPVSSPCMLLGLMTGLHNRISVNDFGLDNKTDADGLAVARPSGLVGKELEQLISGVFTVQDVTLYKLLCMTREVQNMPLEPSAAAGIPGPFKLTNTPGAEEYLQDHGLQEKMPDATHIVWATGGSMVPEEVMQEYYSQGTCFKNIV